MLSDLQFVIGAVAKKDYEERLCHLEVRNGRAVAYGGRISMSTPITCPFDVRPHARSLVKAVQACGDGEIGLSMTAGGRLTIKAGKFRAHIDCVPQDTKMPQLIPEGEYFEVTDEFINSIKVLAPFMSIDASRAWAQGLRIGEYSTYVTNNIVLAQRWHGARFPKTVIIPADAVHELIRIGENPVGIQYSDHSLTFFFPRRRWLCTHLIAEEGGWDKADQIFDRNTAPDGLQAVPQGLYDALDTLKPFLGDRGLIYLLGNRIATHPTEGEGADIEALVASGPIFHAAQLRSLEKIATQINFTAYPRPCYFIGEKLRGIIVGVNA